MLTSFRRTDVSSVFLGVPGDAVRGLGGDVHLQRDSVVLHVALLGVQHVIPTHEMGEAPIVLFATIHKTYTTSINGSFSRHLLNV